MYQAAKYLFYRIYKWQLSWWGKEDVPEFTAAIGVSIMFFINIFTILILIENISGLIIIDSFKYPRMYITIFGVILLYINYLLFIRKGKYLRIAEEFKKESKIMRKRRTKWIWTYVIGTHTIIPIIMILKNVFNY